MRPAELGRVRFCSGDPAVPGHQALADQPCSPLWSRLLTSVPGSHRPACIKIKFYKTYLKKKKPKTKKNKTTYLP